MEKSQPKPQPPSAKELMKHWEDMINESINHMIGLQVSVGVTKAMDVLVKSGKLTKEEIDQVFSKHRDEEMTRTQQMAHEKRLAEASR